eukprot:TRINITY_DN1871_c0_g1_i1.p1 TRINITY_DN1871_c0_g1~~TRINITY_DN1871_c0_g1_i1.p1  ORF type:complete len:200 (-),score=52.34 TRINITY_DN1871_c0_g1_i1:111-710(-)
MADKERYKVIILGNIDVGKTSLIVRFVDKTFEESTTQEFETKEGSVAVEGKEVLLSIQDTAGQERFRTLTSSYYRNANAMIVVYDVTNKESFDVVEGFVKEGNTYSSSSCCKFLVGNKKDLEDKRVVSRAEGEEIAGRLKIPFFETSAKSGDGVDALFQAIGKQFIGNQPSSSAPAPGPGSAPPKPGNKPASAGCCTVA